MIKKILSIAIIAALSSNVMAQKTFDISVSNPAKTERKATPIVIKLDKFGIKVKSAIVTNSENKEIPSQLDDLNGDKVYDELCFMTDLNKKEIQKFSIRLMETGKQK